MAYITRQLETTLSKAARAFPALVLTGPRRAGKTTLLQRLFPKASYRLLEDPAILAAARADPRGFLDALELPVILDEIQNVPELLNFIRVRIDQAPSRMGRWLLTGSQDFSLMRGVTESMAGRAGVLQLLPLSTLESERVTPFKGGYAEVLARPRNAPLWFQSYVQTYIERDVRQISQIRDLAAFRRFLSLLASRSGQLLNKTDLAAPLGVSVPTITEWLSILETTGQVLLVPPYFENFGKRIVKTPKVYMTDSGLACHLLGFSTVQELARSTFTGPIFEGFVASEIVKQQINAGRRREIYFFRDQRGLEIDFIVPGTGRRLVLLEVKSSQTVYPEAARHMLGLADSIGRKDDTRCIVVHAGGGGGGADRVLAPGVRSLSVTETLHALSER
jgi:predicted AAA+ superfamily ATPase